MSAGAKEMQARTEVEQLKARLKTIWTTGDYDQFSRYMEKDAEEFFRRLEIPRGARLLDVGCGAGQLCADRGSGRSGSYRMRYRG